MSKHLYYIASLFLCMLFSSSIIAADWDLLQPNKEAFYCVERDGTEFTSRYEVDSLSMNSDGSLTYLINNQYRNDFFSACTSWNEYGYLGDMGIMDFFSVDSIRISDHLHHITYGSDTLIIPTKAEVGESLSNSSFEINCFQKELLSFLGTTDSVKFYSISSDMIQDTLMLSKNYGLIETPYFFDLLNNMPTISRLKLTGTEIDGDFFGNRTDDILEFLPYQVGDSLNAYTSSGSIISTKRYIDLVVNDVISSAGILTINSFRDMMIVTSDAYGSDTTYFSGDISQDYDLISLQNALDYSIHYYTQAYIKSLFLDTPVSTALPIVRIDHGFDTLLSQKTFGLYSFNTEADLTACVLSANTDSNFRIDFTACYGETYSGDHQWQDWSNFSLNNPPNSSLSCTDALPGCTEAGWEIVVDSYSGNSLSYDFELYPNPSSDYISLRSDSKHILKVSFVDMQGRRILETEDTDIDVSQLKNGLYYVLIEHSEGVSIQKFTKI